MKISKQEVEYVAQLARLSLSEKELDMMTGQLDNILAYVDKLAELDTTDVEPTSHVLSITNALREDVAQPSLAREQAVQNGPNNNGEFFQVPKIM